jgi:Zn-finger protein
LEKGVVMFDSEYAENILVIAPVLFMDADNPRLAEIVGLKNSRAVCPCRSCFWQADPSQAREKVENLELFQTSIDDSKAEKRTKKHIEEFNKTIGDSTSASCDPGIEMKNRGRPKAAKIWTDWSDLGFKNTGGHVFTELRSFDPTTDTP